MERPGRPAGDRPFRFRSRGGAWWGGVRPFPISAEKSLWLGVILPESDLLGALRQERFKVVAVALAALLLSMVLAWHLSRRYSGSLEEIARQSKRIAALDLTSELHSSSRLSEIRELSDSLEAMRVSLARYVAERRQSEEELSRAAQEWQTTFDATNDVIWILDADQRVVRSNRTAERYLPASDRAVIEEQEPEIELVEGTGTVLLVDDEAMVVDVGKPMLEKLGYRVLEANGGHEALRVYGEKQSTIDIVVLDMIMPDLNGGETLDRLKEIDPEIKELLSCDYSINGQAQRIIFVPPVPV